MKRYKKIFNEADRMDRHNKQIEAFIKSRPQRIANVEYIDGSEGFGGAEVYWKKGKDITSVTFEKLSAIPSFDAVSIKNNQLVIRFIY